MDDLVTTENLSQHNHHHNQQQQQQQSSKLINETSNENEEGKAPREIKRYKTKSKTEFITSDEHKRDEQIKQQQMDSEMMHSGDFVRHGSIKMPASSSDSKETTPITGILNDTNTMTSDVSVGMSIQQRLAALKKSGEEEWKKRAVNSSNPSNELTSALTASNSMNNELIHFSAKNNLVKQHKEQLQQQLQIKTPKPQFLPNNQISEMLSSSSGKSRNILATLNDNRTAHGTDEESDKNRMKMTQSTESIDSLDVLMQANAAVNQREKKTPVQKRVVLNPSILNSVESALSKGPKQSKMVRMHSAGSDTDTVFTRNAMMIQGNTSKKPYLQHPQQQQQRVGKSGGEIVELFSTDSEIDSFFKENENLLNKFTTTSSSTSPNNNNNNKTTDENEEIEDEEFNRIASDAHRLTQGTRAKPSRKTKSKGNHLKNLQNRIEIKQEYEQSPSSNKPGIDKSSVF